MPNSIAAGRASVYLLAATAALCCCQGTFIAAATVDGMIELRLQDRKVEGMPIFWSDSEVHLLGRDGRLWEFRPDEARDFKQTSAHFRSFSTSELRAALLRELGSDYEVSGTGHYVIAHPRDQRDKWAERFEDLYRSFTHYFSVRGYQPPAPPFPLVGIVCRNHDDFSRMATAQLGGAPGGVTGYYDILSNRITLYDMGGQGDSAGKTGKRGGHGDSDNWKKNAAVLIHEATHQSAFNSGIHSRYCPPPKWLAEGLATLFEAPGVYDSHANTRPADRVNRDRFKAFREGVAPRHRPELLAGIVASDELFGSNPGAAYAEAWAMTFFLVETEPAKYVRYLKLTAARPAFQQYTAAERIADFVAVFGGNWRMLEARFLRFMEGVR
jgi:hypothetical protein